MPSTELRKQNKQSFVSVDVEAQLDILYINQLSERASLRSENWWVAHRIRHHMRRYVVRSRLLFRCCEEYLKQWNHVLRRLQHWCIQWFHRWVKWRQLLPWNGERIFRQIICTLNLKFTQRDIDVRLGNLNAFWNRARKTSCCHSIQGQRVINKLDRVLLCESTK